MKTKKIIKTSSAPKAIGAYSQAVSYENLLFTSGQIPLSPDTGMLVSDDIKEQIMQVLDNIEGILFSENLSFINILKLNVYLTDLNDFSLLNEIFIDRFDCDFPARSVVEVSKLPKDSRVEIDAICFR